MPRMSLIYTDATAIQQRLKGRLSIGGPQSAFGSPSVDEALLEQIGEQVEAKVNAVLRQSYQFPLAAATELNTESRPLMAAIVEKGIICEISDTHFYTSEEGNSYGRQMCKDFAAELMAIESGNIRLPGETLLTATDFENANYSGIATRTPGIAEGVIW